MDGCVGGDKGQSIRQFKAAARMQRPIKADARRADGRFLNQLHGQSRFDAICGLPRPTTQ